jgi:hypothetical protein
LEELRAAALEACREIEDGEAQAGSSMASRLRALGGHITRRMWRALHLGVQKALDVVDSHYQVDLEAVSTGYVIPVNDDDEVAMNRAPPLLLPTSSSRTSRTSCFRTLPRQVAPSLKITGHLCHWCFEC